jgi:hypothetical protein
MKRIAIIVSISVHLTTTFASDLIAVLPLGEEIPKGLMLHAMSAQAAPKKPRIIKENPQRFQTPEAIRQMLPVTGLDSILADDLSQVVFCMYRGTQEVPVFGFEFLTREKAAQRKEEIQSTLAKKSRNPWLAIERDRVIFFVSQLEENKEQVAELMTSIRRKFDGSPVK